MAESSYRTLMKRLEVRNLIPVEHIKQEARIKEKVIPHLALPAPVAILRTTEDQNSDHMLIEVEE